MAPLQDRRTPSGDDLLACLKRERRPQARVHETYRRGGGHDSRLKIDEGVHQKLRSQKGRHRDRHKTVQEPRATASAVAEGAAIGARWHL